MDDAIRVSNLGKAYKQYQTKWSRLFEWMLPCLGIRYQEKWVLRNISFHVVQGEAVGIIGVNGAGKSTLLKLITGTIQPTFGTVFVRGRVSALLELGMGFHPEFTGRQNVIMAGQLLGLSVEDIENLMPQIEAFAEIGDYIDQQVRVYSSGMLVRLAFSLATAKRPNILIIDEALAVGDAAFQRKCFQRIESFRAQKTTLLFVSHDIESVKRLCDQAVFIHQGRIENMGRAKSVCDSYEEKLFGKSNKNQIARNVDSSTTILDSSLAGSIIEKQYGDGSAEISDVVLRDEDNQPFNVISEGKSFSVNYRVSFNKVSRGVKFGMMIKSVDGVCIYGTNTEGQSGQQLFQGDEVADIRFHLQGNLVPGTYFLNVGTTREGKEAPEFMHRKIDTLIFRIVQAHLHVSVGYANMFALSKVVISTSSPSSDLKP